MLSSRQRQDFAFIDSLFVFHSTFLLRLVLWDVFASLYYLNMRVYLFQISVESSWTFEDFKTATAESIDSLSVSSINLQVQCLSSVIFTLIFGSKMYDLMIACGREIIILIGFGLIMTLNMATSYNPVQLPKPHSFFSNLFAFLHNAHYYGAVDIFFYYGSIMRKERSTCNLW